MPSESNEHPDDHFEDQALALLAEVGLIVPTRDPNRPHTKKEERCGKDWFLGLSRDGGGRPFGWSPDCQGWGCANGAAKRARWEMGAIRRACPDFVALSDIYRETPVYAENRDKIGHPALWIASVATPPEKLIQLRLRIKTRAERLVDKGVAVDLVLVPCDGAAVIVSTADLAEEKSRGRPQLASLFHADPDSCLL